MPEPAAAAALDSARSALQQVAVELRQLDDDRRRAFRSLGPCVEDERRNIVVTVILTAASLFLATLWIHVTLGIKQARLAELVPTAAGTLGILAFGLVRVAALYRRLAELAEPWAAHVPDAPGEPPRCHVCGAPVAVGEAQAVARCSYCSADNLVEPTWLARMRKRHHLVVDGLEQTVVSEATALSDLSFDVDRWSLAVRCSLPILCPLAIWLCFSIVQGYEGPFDTSAHYRRAYDGCLVEATPSTGDALVDPSKLVGGLAWGASRDVAGMEMKVGGRILGLSGNPIFGNRARVFESAREEVIVFHQLCPAQR